MRFCGPEFNQDGVVLEVIKPSLMASNVAVAGFSRLSITLGDLRFGITDPAIGQIDEDERPLIKVV